MIRNKRFFIIQTVVMTPLFAILYILVGMLVISGLFSISLIVAKYETKQNVIFTCISLLLIIYTIGYSFRYSAGDINQFIFAEKIINISIFVAGALFVHFISILTKYKSKLLKTFLIVLFLSGSLHSLFSQFGGDYSNITELTKIDLIWGEKIVWAKGETSNFFWIIDIILIFSLYYIFEASRHIYNSGRKVEAAFIGFAFTLIIFSILFDNIFVESGKINLPYTQQFAFVSVIFISGMKGFQSLLDHKDTEKALVHSEEKYNQLTKVSFDGVCITQNGIIRDMNQQFLSTFRMERDQLLGKNINNLFIRSTGESENKFDGRKDIYEKWCKRGDKSEFPGELRTKSASIDGEKFNINVLRDITQRKSYENKLIVAKNKAESSEKIKTEFLAQMSHEIRTPINTILSFSELISEAISGKIEGELNDSFEFIQNAGKRIIRTVDLLLNMSEVQTDSYSPIKTKVDLLKDILKEQYNNYKSEADKADIKFELNIEKSEKPFLINGDKYTLSAIFNNLIDNAIKYTPKGSVSIKIYRPKSNQINIDITDSGIGISEEYMPKLFSLFSQEEQGYTRSYDGNGLGLALVDSYLKINRAKIKVESKKNMGSRFRIIFNSNTVL